MYLGYFCKNLDFYLLQVLKVIYWSRNGVLFNELLEVSHYLLLLIFAKV